jgi:hypothetical protein
MQIPENAYEVNFVLTDGKAVLCLAPTARGVGPQLNHATATDTVSARLSH